MILEEVDQRCLMSVCVRFVCMGMPRRYIPMYKPREVSWFNTGAAIVDFSHTSGLMKQR